MLTLSGICAAILLYLCENQQRLLSPWREIMTTCASSNDFSPWYEIRTACTSRNGFYLSKVARS